MNVYLLDSLAAQTFGHPRWQPPVPLYVHGGPNGQNHFLTGGGLIRHGNTIYMLTVEDLSSLTWSFCQDSSSPSSQNSSGSARSAHSAHAPCQKVTRFAQHYDNNPPPALGIMGQLVHLSTTQGYGLVRVDPGFYAGDEEHVLGGAASIPIETFGAYVDEPRLMDFVEFATCSGEEVTGVVISSHTYCVRDTGNNYAGPGSGGGGGGGRRKKIDGLLLVDTSSYTVAPEDCGVWVRRSVASSRPMLLGHIVGFSEAGSCGFLMLPFSRFAADLHRVILTRRFNLVA